MMTLLNSAELNESNMIERLSKVIVFVACILLAFAHGLYAGFELGQKQNSTGIYSTFGSGYQLLANTYFYIFLLLILYIVGLLLRTKVLAHFICIVTLLLTVFQFRVIYLQKIQIANSGDEFSKLMRDTVTFDWLIFLSVCLLFALQLTAIVQQNITACRRTQ